MELVKNETHGGILQVFNCELGQVRVIVENGEPLFLASDIAQALGYEKKSKMYERLDDDDKVVKSPKIHGSSILELPQNVTKVMFITESGLYDSILGSNKPQAKQFKKWITRDVLPSIRKMDIGIKDSSKYLPQEVNSNCIKVDVKLFNFEMFNVETPLVKSTPYF